MVVYGKSGKPLNVSAIENSRQQIYIIKTISANRKHTIKRSTEDYYYNMCN